LTAVEVQLAAGGRNGRSRMLRWCSGPAALDPRVPVGYGSRLSARIPLIPLTMEKESRDHEEANPDPAKQTQLLATEPGTEGEKL
jgi:hypothetical protein